MPAAPAAKTKPTTLVAVTKIACTPEGDEALTREAANLRAFDSGVVSRGAARLLFQERVDDQVAGSWTPSVRQGALSSAP